MLREYNSYDPSDAVFRYNWCPRISIREHKFPTITSNYGEAVIIDGLIR